MAKLLEKSLLGADYARQSFRATPPAGTTLDEMLAPEYWAHVAQKVNPHDLIEVVPEDGAFFARLFVVSTQKLSMKVAKLEYVEFSTTAIAETAKVKDEFECKWSGPAAKWRVHRKADNSLATTDSFASREDAETWLGINIKSLAA